MNLRVTGRYIGYLLLLEAAFLLPPFVVALLYAEQNTPRAFLFTAGLCVAAGLVLCLLCGKPKAGVYAREGFVIAGGGWVLISLFGAFPYVFSGATTSFVDAVFESVSGFTTSGASIFADVTQISHSLLFWRSFTTWLGGVGVLAFLLSLLRAQKGGGFALHLWRAETPGPQASKVMPKMQGSAQMIYFIYIGLSLLNLAFLLLGGMPLFDAFCTMFGTAGTGGFAIHPDGLASYSPYLQTVTAVFMFLFSISFTLYFLLLRGEWKAALHNEELHLYVGIMLVSTIAITLNVIPVFGSLATSIQQAFFSVSSTMSTTGFAAVNLHTWPHFTRALLLMLTLSGSMAGSTGGGFKMARLLILLKGIGAGLHRLAHPRSVKSVRLNGKTLEDHVVQDAYMFLGVYVMAALASFLLISLDNMPTETNLSAVLACFNNIGPDLALMGNVENFAGYSVFSKIVLSIDMLLGRLEIFPIIMLLTPATWRLKS